VSNLYLQPDRGSLEDLVSGVEDGFLITELLGLHTADPISGDFSLGASGTWIENGNLTFPVQGAAISGNLMDLFKRVARVGGDLRFMGTIGSPSLLLDHLDVAG
jgi:PmbA protein